MKMKLMIFSKNPKEDDPQDGQGPQQSLVTSVGRIFTGADLFELDASAGVFVDLDVGQGLGHAHQEQGGVFTTPELTRVEDAAQEPVLGTKPNTKINWNLNEMHINRLAHVTHSTTKFLAFRWLT